MPSGACVHGLEIPQVSSCALGIYDRCDLILKSIGLRCLELPSQTLTSLAVGPESCLGAEILETSSKATVC
jgi:hypothetical protein